MKNNYKRDKNCEEDLQYPMDNSANFICSDTIKIVHDINVKGIGANVASIDVNSITPNSTIEIAPVNLLTNLTTTNLPKIIILPGKSVTVANQSFVNISDNTNMVLVFDDNMNTWMERESQLAGNLDGQFL